MTNKLFTETLPPKTNSLILQLQDTPLKLLSKFYLSCGTALSLQIGHRESEDLDFFTEQDFDPREIENELNVFGKLEEVDLQRNTLNAFLNGVKLQFLGYPYSLLAPTINWNNIRLGSVIDIACTKMQTIGMRGSKKDFIDLFFLLDKFTLTELFDAVDKKYTNVEYSKSHIMKSLVYFKDAELEPMPRMHKDVKWKDVKEKIISSVKEINF